MKELSRHIVCCLFATLCALGAGSCTSDPYPGAPEEAERLLLVLHIAPLEAGQTPAAAVAAEKIRSLRIILLSDGMLECNKLISFDGTEIFPGPLSTSQFQYDFTWSTFAGNKEFYLIANEASVTGLRFQEPEGDDAQPLPGNLPDDLTTLLNSYEPDAPAKGTDAEKAAARQKGEAFARLLQAACFEPDYRADRNGDLFLPYVSYYGDIEVQRGAENDDVLGGDPLRMFLVPAATKFTFHFVNHRPNDVEVNKIEVKKIDTHNFLLARVGAKDYAKDFDGTSYYWIDWLARVSAASHANPGAYENGQFNSIYGWIADYAMPAVTVPTVARLLGGADAGTDGADGSDGSDGSDDAAGGGETAAPRFVVPAQPGETDPAGELQLGPYYLPESWYNAFVDKNNQNPDEPVDGQAYYLTLGLHDVTQEEADDPLFNDVTISNLKALFRNTSVLIKVTMYQGEVAIYAEIADWNPKWASGWVNEGDEGKDN